jgi:hypothetical protein
VRRIPVAALPEEEVRQSVLLQLTSQLGYPLGTIGVEKSLRQFHSSPSQSCPDRRVDILCFHQQKPLLLIECKAIPLDKKSWRQVIGYNIFVQAPFIALVNQQTTQFGWFDPSIQDFQCLSFIPPYSQLIATVQKNMLQ